MSWMFDTGGLPYAARAGHRSRMRPLSLRRPTRRRHGGQQGAPVRPDRRSGSARGGWPGRWPGGRWGWLAVLGEELHHVVQAEATIAPLADAIEGQLTPVSESLHRVHVEVEHV